MSIEVQHVSRRFGDFAAVSDVSLRIPSNALVALLGPSGSGKTTLLRIIAGLERPDVGAVLLDGERADGRSARERGVGFVFQHYALFRHMTVFDNVAFGLTVRPRALRPSRREIREKVQSLLALVHLDTMASRYPSQLSGGQRQRVALARALAVEPQVLLLDEPFGSLDAKVRLELRRWLRRLHDELHVTSVFVTHDQEEAMEVADTVVVMNAGRVEQVGTPEEVYHHPANPFVYHFLGNVNLFHGRVQEGRVRIGDLEIESPEHAGILDGPVVGYARPHDLEVDRTAGGEGAIAAMVGRVQALGPTVRVELTRGDTGDLIEAHLSRERQAEISLKTGERVYVRPIHVRVFPGENI